MPPYQATPPPPQSLAKGDVGYSFGSLSSHKVGNVSGNYPNVVVEDVAGFSDVSEPIPAAGTAGSQFGLPQDLPGATIVYGTNFDAAPSAVTVALQGAMQDKESEYFTLDSDRSEEHTS